MSLRGSGGLAERGVSAHRGGAATHPENTLAAFRHAVACGAHQVEFDVRASADGAIVVIHDASVDRTTDGRGRVARLRLSELRALDAGGWKHPRFAGERIPTLEEALSALPRDVWINLQIKRDEPVAEAVARLVVGEDRLHQVIVACGNAAARAARAVHPKILVCNLVRKRSREAYVEHAIATGADFVQFHHLRGAPDAGLIARAKSAGVRVNYFCDPQDERLDALFAAGVDFALVDDVPRAMKAWRKLAVE